MEYLFLVPISYVGTILMSKGVSLSTIIVVMKDLKKKGYKLTKDYFKKESLGFNKDLFIPLYNLIQSLDIGYSYTLNKEEFLNNLIESGNCIKIENDDNVKVNSQVSLKTVKDKIEEKKPSNINKEVDLIAIKETIDSFNEELSDNLEGVWDNFLDEYPNIKVLFNFNLGTSTYHFLMKSKEIKLLAVESNDEKDNPINLLSSKYIRKELINLVNLVIDTYFYDKKKIIKFIKEGNYLIDDNFYDLDDIEKTIGSFMVNGKEDKELKK